MQTCRKHQNETTLLPFNNQRLTKSHLLSKCLICVHQSTAHTQLCVPAVISSPLTELGAPHKVVAGLFGVPPVHLAGLRVELGELVSVEAVVVIREAEGRRAVGHGRKRFLLHGLGFQVVVEDVFACEKQKQQK